MQWSDFRKGVQLVIITLAAIVPDFDAALGMSPVLPFSKVSDIEIYDA